MGLKGYDYKNASDSAPVSSKKPSALMFVELDAVVVIVIIAIDSHTGDGGRKPTIMSTRPVFIS